MNSPRHSASFSRAHTTTFQLAAFVAAASLAGVSSADSPCGCSADFNGSGSVDASDLALLLGAWGAVDTSYDLTGNGGVDAADLGIILGQWGACGGPANDTCQTAEILPAVWTQLVPFCNVNAGTDGPPHPLCNSTGSDQIFNDVWYKVAAPTSGTLDISTCGATFDTRLAVYEPGLFGSTCPQSGIVTALLLDCNDDDLECTAAPLSSHLVVPVTAGTTYTVRVGDFLGDEGTGNLSLQFHPKGDLCSDPIEVYLSSFGNPAASEMTLTGDTFHATPGGDNADPTTCGGRNDSKDLWFHVHIDCSAGGQVPVSLSASTCLAGTSYDTTLAIYSGSCGNLVELECNDDHTFSNCAIGGVNRKSYVSINPENSAQDFYVRLAGYNGAIGSYEIKFSLGCL